MQRILLCLMLVGFLSLNPAFAAENFMVKDTKIEGLHRISKDAVLQALSLSPNENISEARSAEMIKALFKTGFFESIDLSHIAQTLIITVVERPTISELTITGIKDQEKIIKILKEHSIAEGRIFSVTKLSEAQKELEKHYLMRGRYGVKIDPKVTHGKNNKIELKIAIFEGDLAQIKEIKIMDHSGIVKENKEILKDLHLKKTNWLSWYTHDDQYSKAKLDADLEFIRSYYMDRGFIAFQIDSTQVSLSPNKKNVYININVTQGDKFVLNTVKLSGSFAGTWENLHPLITPLKKGETFSRRAIIEVKENLEDRLGSQGYSFAEVRPATIINPLTKEIDLDFTLIPMKLVYVDKINIKGNDITQDEVIRRELPQMEGTWISTELVKEGKNNILRRGFATNVEVETKLKPGMTDKVDIFYSIEEAKVREFSASIGYSPTERFMYRLGVTQQNFLGTGKTIDFTFENSKPSTTYNIGYLDPYFTLDGIGFGGNAYYNKSHLSKGIDISEYTTDSLGTNITWIIPLAQHEFMNYKLGYDHTHLKLPNNTRADEINNFITKNGTRFIEYYAQVGWKYNTQDRAMMPTKGIMHSFLLKFSLPQSKLNYHLTTFDSSWYYPIKGDYIFNLTGSLGYGNGYGKSKDLPFFKNFYLGGTGSVRGYKEGSLGPKDSLGKAFGGNALVNATAAIILPVPFKSDIKTVRPSVFFDVGQVYDTRYKYKIVNNDKVNRNSTGLRYSAGLSVTWYTPIGAPLVVSIAKPLWSKQGDSKRTIALTFGTQM